MTVNKEAIRVFVATFALFALTNSGFDTSEGAYHYAVAKQIVRTGSLGFDQPRDGIFTVAPNGRTYASHEIGNTLPLLPLALLEVGLEKIAPGVVGPERFEQLMTFIRSFFPAIYLSVAACFVFLIQRTIFVMETRPAVINVFAVVCCTFYWTYSRNLFDGVFCTMLLTIAVFFLFWHGKFSTPRTLVLAFLFLGLGLITRLSMILPIAAAGLYLLVSARTMKEAVANSFVAGVTLLPFLGWQAAYNLLRTGHPLTSPVQTAQYAQNNGFSGDIATGLAGLLFSPGKSIFVYAPILLLSILVFPVFYRRYRSEALFVGSLGTAWLLLHAGLNSWYGAWGWGPRHFITVIPVLSLPFLVCSEDLRTNVWKRFITGGALLWGALLATASLLTNWHYQLRLAFQNGLGEDRVVWSLQDSQAIDTLLAAAGNLYRLVAGGATQYVEGATAADTHAATTVNVWMNLAHYMGVPWIVIIPLMAGLIALLVINLRDLLREPERFAMTMSAAGGR